MNTPLPAGSLDPIGYVCIEAHTENGWILCFHGRRKSWECPGGHVEAGETPMEAARRELYEETGALDYDLRPVWDYRQYTEDGTFHNNGRVYYAEVRSCGPLPACSEMTEIRCFPALTDDVRYTYDRKMLDEMLSLAFRLGNETN